MSKELINSTLLEGLGGKGIGITVCDLAKYIASTGILVSPFVGRTRGFIPLPGAAYGINPDNMSEQGAGFYKSRVAQGHLNLIPQEDENELGRLEKRLRRAVEARTLTDVFMPVKAYEDLKSEFNNIREEYFATRDRIGAKWDVLVAEFENGAREMLEGIEMPQQLRAKLMGDFMSQVPTKEDYVRSFKMELHVKAFPAVNVTEGLSDSIAADVKATWQEDVVSTAILSIERQIGEGWSRLNKAMNSYVKADRLAPVAIKAISKFAVELRWKNVFNNALLTKLSDTLVNLDSVPDETAAEKIEDGIAYIYKYAKENHLDLNLKGISYDAFTLDSMAKTLAA